jgi:hypothetical protein
LELLDFIKTYNLELLSEYKLITKQWKIKLNTCRNRVLSY